MTTASLEQLLVKRKDVVRELRASNDVTGIVSTYGKYGQDTTEEVAVHNDAIRLQGINNTT